METDKDVTGYVNLLELNVKWKSEYRVFRFKPIQRIIGENWR